MNVTLSSAKAMYLTRVAAGLADLPEEDREEVLAELEAHLVELDDAEVEPTLGPPGEFVAEFRRSAGLQSRAGRSHFDATRRAVARLRAEAGRLSAAVGWNRFRPAWVWTRGWVLISAWSILQYGEGFRRFPVPQIGGSTLTGLFLVVAATLTSLWLERDVGSRQRRTGSTVFSVLAGLGLLGSLLNPIYPGTHIVVDDPAFFSDRLTGPGLVPIHNIYAYDLEGDPVEVLLFDHEGHPLLTMPEWVYQAWSTPGQPVDFGEGQVVFPLDELGRIIPNLYPLQISTYDQDGRVQPVPPPSIGIPFVEEQTPSTPTTVVPGR